MKDQIRLQHIFNSIQEIESFIENSDFDVFRSNSMMNNAVIRQIEIIGEAIANISLDFKKTTNKSPGNK